MYNYGTSQADRTTRMWGLGIVAGVTGGLAIALVTMRFTGVFEEKKSEVAIIDVQEEIIEEPPPPPPVDIDLPPPPPMVIVPQLTFDVPPPPAAITQVAPAVDRPAPAPQTPAPAARPPPPALPPVRPRADPDRFSKMLVEDYPATALRRKQEGDVTLAMCMSADGRASNVRVVKSSGVDQLDDAAVKGVAKLRFTPAKDSGGKAVAWCPPTYPDYQMTLSWKLPK